ncbi:MAG TPA: class I SAM-dependent methyltransferase [Methanofastidiosum sp.]|nr:class I SAM-dependent methyltransferase [Methanofastidiosum sp.]
MIKKIIKHARKGTLGQTSKNYIYKKLNKTFILFKKLLLKLKGKKYPSYYKFIPNKLVELDNIKFLKDIFEWKNAPILEDHEYGSNLDNDARRIIDAQVLGTIICNFNPKRVLEIGTYTGHGTALISKNAPKSHIFTLNILPEEIISGQGGSITTEAITKERIGEYYREQKLNNITQIYANTATWEPDIGNIDVAFIDGCHDTEFVYNDTIKVLKIMKSGSFIMWHDFNMDQILDYDHINSVCKGIEKLYAEGYLKGQLFHVKDSWMGIYRVP